MTPKRKSSFDFKICLLVFLTVWGLPLSYLYWIRSKQSFEQKDIVASIVPNTSAVVGGSAPTGYQEMEHGEPIGPVHYFAPPISDGQTDRGDAICVNGKNTNATYFDHYIPKSNRLYTCGRFKRTGGGVFRSCIEQTGNSNAIIEEEKEE